MLPDATERFPRIFRLLPVLRAARIQAKSACDYMKRACIILALILGGIVIGALSGYILGELTLPTVEELERTDERLKNNGKAPLKLSMWQLEYKVYGGVLGAAAVVVSLFMYRAHNNGRVNERFQGREIV